MGALVSGCLGHRPLFVVDRNYRWEKGVRLESLIFNPQIPEELLEAVLIIAGEVHAGTTMRMYHDYFNQIGARCIKRAALYYERGATIEVDYIGVESSRKEIQLPWQFSPEYVRAWRASPPPQSRR